MDKDEKEPTSLALPTGGIIMPIGDFKPYPSGHWGRVRQILEDSIKGAGFNPNMVCDSDETPIITKAILDHIIDDEVVVCDVSGLNPNVILELGIRLAYDKATVIVKDEFTEYPFDTSIVKYVQYPSTLWHADIEDFKQKLKDKIIAIDKSVNQDGKPMYLGYFSSRIVSPGGGMKKVTPEDFDLFLLQRLDAMSSFLGSRLQKIERKLSSSPGFQDITRYRSESQLLSGLGPVRLDGSYDSYSDAYIEQMVDEAIERKRLNDTVLGEPGDLDVPREEKED